MEAIDFWLYHLRVSLWFIVPGWIIGVMSLARDIEHDLELRNSRRVKYVDKVGRVLFHLLIGLVIREKIWDDIVAGWDDFLNKRGIDIVYIFFCYWFIRSVALLFFAPLEPYRKDSLKAAKELLDDHPEIDSSKIEDSIEIVELP